MRIIFPIVHLNRYHKCVRDLAVACGAYVSQNDNERRTDDWRKVTCKTCRRTRTWRLKK